MHFILAREGVLDLIRMSSIFFNDPQGTPSQMYSIPTFDVLCLLFSCCRVLFIILSFSFTTFLLTDIIIILASSWSSHQSSPFSLAPPLSHLPPPSTLYLKEPRLRLSQMVTLALNSWRASLFQEASTFCKWQFLKLHALLHLTFEFPH